MSSICLVLLIVAASVKLSESLLHLLWCEVLAQLGELLQQSRISSLSLIHVLYSRHAGILTKYK